MAPQYEILRAGKDFDVGGPASVWREFPSLSVDHYLWLKNGYEPRVRVQLGLTDRFLYVRFDVEEKKVRARFTRFQDPVYKDSCVEFFVDPFPDLKRGYLNFEANAVGTFLIAFGPDRRSRRPLRKADLRGFKSASSIKRPMDGEIRTGRWALAYRIPLELFDKMYGRPVRPGGRGAANFYKCGDEAEFPHYGAWSPVGTPSPDFHRPEFFGTLIFGRM
ncbi:MAG: carbohydrate-binding family 9-like protein [Candidatus Aminicenantales bacterium]|jgi:hypothetical protein